jgi:hypothetical protein
MLNDKNHFMLLPTEVVGRLSRDRMVVTFTTTVNPVLRGHLWDKEKVTL